MRFRETNINFPETRRVSLLFPLERWPALILFSALTLSSLALCAGEDAESDVGGTILIDAAVEPDKDKEDENLKPVYRGSLFTYRNVGSAISLARDAELTYNPYYAMIFMIEPMFWTGEHGHLNLGISISREITNSDWTTKEGETILDDITLGIGLSNIWTIPIVEIGISPSLDVIIPTSKSSRARSLICGINPGVGLARIFDVLSGLSLSYSFGFIKSFHYYTTAQNEEPIIDAAPTSTRSMASYMNTGVRNASFDISNVGVIGIEFVSWLGLSVSGGIVHSYLYELNGQEENTSLETEDSSSIRYAMIYSAEIHSRPIPALAIAIGAETVSPQLSSDSTYEMPFINRYTAIYLDLKLDVAGLVSQITSKNRRKRQ
ncbi:MAG: hypothetical protein GY854_03405 [Deltaproteobacteria bacterium]|nr:hypothetical protein [Deltaproteobacteria bacterium]